MLHIIRPKHLLFSTAVLLATVVGCIQMPLAHAASTLKKGEPIAVVYHLCKTGTKPTTCLEDKGTYYVHNGMSLANQSPTANTTKVGHVGAWKMGNHTQKNCPFVPLPR